MSNMLERRFEQVLRSLDSGETNLQNALRDCVDICRDETSNSKELENNMKAFTRNELIEIRERAKEVASSEGLSPGWQQAYKELAHAANTLDALIARATLPNTTLPEDEDE